VAPAVKFGNPAKRLMSVREGVSMISSDFLLRPIQVRFENLFVRPPRLEDDRRVNIVPIRFCVIATVSALFVVGCAGGKAVEARKPNAVQKVTTIQAVQEKGTTAIPPNISTRFQSLLEEALYEENQFGKGSELTVKWTITASDEGNRVVRYWAGLFGAGKAKIKVSAKFFDRKGHEVGAIESEGHISMGAFGGSYKSAMSVCADAIAKYATRNFLAGSR
jgi:hypothetical protein